jgi:xanthine dehydrogenase accessory factor
MLVLPGKETLGTVGGGNVEQLAIEECTSVLHSGKPLLKEFGLTEETSGMWCGGKMTLLFEPFLPPARLWIFGYGHVGSEVCRIASASGFTSQVVHDEDVPGIPVFLTNWEALDPFPDVKPEDFVLVLTMHSDSELAIVRRIAALPPRYVGIIGSKSKGRKIREALSAEGIEVESLNLHIPVGLPIGAKTAAEIAVSIAAELIKELHGA